MQGGLLLMSGVEREIFIDNLLVRVHLIIEMSRPALRHVSLNFLCQVALYRGTPLQGYPFRCPLRLHYRGTPIYGYQSANPSEAEPGFFLASLPPRKSLVGVCQKSIPPKGSGFQKWRWPLKVPLNGITCCNTLALLVLVCPIESLCMVALMVLLSHPHFLHNLKAMNLTSTTV